MPVPAASPGHTSILAAVGRAVHLESESLPLVSDPFALDLAGEAGTALLAALRTQTTPDGLATLGRAFAIRARLVEDEVEEAAARGVRQYVVLGAGLDSFALRRSPRATGVRVFEVDRPAAQGWKRARMAELGIAEPEGATYVPVDFEAGGLREGLREAGFDFTQPAITSWIAVVQYLHPAAIDETLTVIADLPRGSLLVMTYVVPPPELSEMERAGLAWTMAQAEERGEPFHALLTSAEADALLVRHGFAGIEHFGPEDLRLRYFPEREDLRLPGIERIVLATR